MKPKPCSSFQPVRRPCCRMADSVAAGCGRPRILLAWLAKANAYVARHGEQAVVQGHGALGVGHAGDFHAADLATLQRDHAAEAPRQHQLRRMVAVLRGQHAVKGRGVAAALYMAEDRGAHLAPEVGLQALAQHMRSEEHTSELQSQSNLVCRLLLEKK